jgi:small GTP-binding protein
MRASNTNAQRTEKIVFLGAQSTGKTAIVTRLQNNTFTANSNSTIGAAFTSKVLMVDGQQLKLDIWDTAGSEKYKSLTPMYYRDARAAIIVIDVTRPETVDAASEWMMELREHGKGDCIIVCAANKSDLVTQRQVTNEQIQDFAFANQIAIWKETSALAGTGITELMNETAKLLLKLPSVETHEDNEIAGLVGDIGTGDYNRDNAPVNKSGCC